MDVTFLNWFAVSPQYSCLNKVYMKSYISWLIGGSSLSFISFSIVLENNKVRVRVRVKFKGKGKGKG